MVSVKGLCQVRILKSSKRPIDLYSGYQLLSHSPFSCLYLAKDITETSDTYVIKKAKSAEKGSKIYSSRNYAIYCFNYEQ